MSVLELDKLKELALRKKELLDSIYDITRNHTFYGKNTEIDRFVEYLNIREPYYKELTEINEKLKLTKDEFIPDFSNSNKIHREVSQLLLDTEAISIKIAELDKENNAKMQKLMDSLAQEMKFIKTSKKARNSYNFFQVQGQREN